MKTIMLMAFRKGNVEMLKAVVLFCLLVLLWPLAQRLVFVLDITAGYVDPSILVLIALSMLCFLGILILNWFLLNWFWNRVGLPSLKCMILGFKDLQLCVQLGFYFGCFALVVLAGVGCLMAII